VATNPLVCSALSDGVMLAGEELVAALRRTYVSRAIRAIDEVLPE
jgi:hypothetical protein